MPVIDVKELRADQQDIAVFLGRQREWIPNTHATLAHSSAALTAYHEAEKSLQRGVLDAKLRESIALAVAGANKSPYCVEMHGFMARQLGLSDEETALNLESISMDRKTAAVLNFVSKWLSTSDIISPRIISTWLRSPRLIFPKAQSECLLSWLPFTQQTVENGRIHAVTNRNYWRHSCSRGCIGPVPLRVPMLD